MSQELKDIVTDINEAFAKNNIEAFLDHCSDDLAWTMAGDRSMTGKDKIRNWMGSMDGHEPPVFTTDTLIAEGNTVVCSGDMKMKGQDGVEGSYKYCDIYVFDANKVVKLTSLVVKDAKSAESHSA